FRPSASGAKKLLKGAVSASLLLGILSVVALGQVELSKLAREAYGGIEVSADGVKAIALASSPEDQRPGFKLGYSEVIRFPLGRTVGGDFAAQASTDTAQAVLKLQSRLREQYKVPAENIYLIGSSRLGADHPSDLVSAITNATGLTLTFLDSVT